MPSRSRVRAHKIKPIVLLLDLDKTMIGDIVPQSEEYYIIKHINNELKNLDKKTIPFNFKRLQNELREYIIRPNLLKFLNLARSYNNVEIYVYTASDDKWAKTLIPHIEKAMNFKFNRPILTRNNTIVQNNNFRKSLKKIKPLIYKSIKNKYNLKNIDELKYIMLFDDTSNVLLEKRLQIKVPAYNSLYQVDYLRNIPDHVVNKFYIIIEDKLNLKHSTDVNGFYSKYHDFIKRRYLYVDANNKKYHNDIYWKKVYKVFKKNIENTSFNKLLSLLKSV
tara:strand:+ start:4610 stop:5443 length:834 start_codon:yes stop_codon:yes gene_type:complete